MSPADATPSTRTPKKGPACPKCGSAETRQTDVYEDAYGHLVTENVCDACGHEFDTKIGGL